MKNKTCLLAIIFLFIFGATLLFESCFDKNPNPASQTVSNENKTYVGSAVCQKCHAQEFKDWETSDHFRAMELPNDSTVLGTFASDYIADGVQNHFFKKDGKYFINMEGRDGKNAAVEVKYTFGFFPLQQYLIEQPGGKLQATRVSWDSKNNRWFHQYPHQKIASNDWLHWTGNGQNWNTMCASCHSTNLQKKYDFVKDEYHTSFSEINVACESCHGPGSQHLEYIASDEYQSGSKRAYSGLSEVTSKTNALQIKNCAPCHARKTDVTDATIYSEELLDNLIPAIISNDNYEADGQIMNEDYEYGSFAQSKMYHHNVTCSNCHNPHSGKLLLAGNAMCLSCHQPKYDSPKHHFHTTNTKSAECVSCHMPEKTYMGNDQRRDHSFRIPRPDQSVVYNTPNTCNSCHAKQSAKWAADIIVKRYGPQRAYHFSDDLLPGSLLNTKSESHLIKLVSDTSQPEIARATAAFYLGDIVTPKSAAVLLAALTDLKALVRYQALRSLENFSPEVWMQGAQKSLSDKVRAVRIAAADLYHRLPPQAIPAQIKTAYAAADGENQKFLQYQTDFAVGNVMVADYELQAGDYGNAISHYVRGLEKDKMMNYARLNLSAAYNSVGNNEEALKTLLFAEKLDPTNDRIYYNLGLLFYEMGDSKKAIINFDKAVKRKSTNPDLYYNYGLLLQQTQQPQLSEGVLKEGYKMNPRSAKITYALTYFYLQANKIAEAKYYAERLYQLEPQNPDYQQIYMNFGFK